MIVQKLLSLVGFEVDEGSAKEVDSTITKIKAGLGAVATLAGAIKFQDFLFGVTEALSESGNLAVSFGVTTEEAQRLEYALSTIGVESNDLGTVFSALNVKLTELRKGSQGVKDEFKLIGLSVKDFKDLNAAQAFKKIAESIKNTKDAQSASTAASKLFGEDLAKKLLPLLKNGKKGLQDLYKESESLGFIFSDEEIARANEYKDGVTRLGATFKALKRRLGVDLLPDAIKVLKTFQKWYKSNRELIKLNLKATVKGIGTALSFLAMVLTFSINKWSELNKLLGGAENTFKTLGGILAALALAKVISSFAMLGKVAFLAGLKAQLPFLGAVALIAVLLLAIDDFQSYLKGENSLLGEWFGPATEENIKKAVGALTAMGAVIALILGLLFPIPVLIALIAGLIVGLVYHWETVKKAFLNMLNEVWEVFKALWGLIKIELAKTYDSWISQGEEAFAKIWGFLTSTFDDAIAGIKRKFLEFLAFFQKGLKPIDSILKKTGVNFSFNDNINNLLGGGAASQAVDRQFQLDKRTNSAPVTDASVSVDKIEINGSDLTKEELKEAVKDGLTEGSLRRAQNNFKGGEV